MANRAVFCICSSEAQASEIVNRLRGEGFSVGDISALLPDRTGTNDFGHEHHTKAPEGATTGALIAGAVCALGGWIAGLGWLSWAPLAPLSAAGPFLSSLSGAAIGLIAGGLIGALIGHRIPEYEAKRYEGKILRGNILISVHCSDRAAARRAKQVFRETGANDIGTRGEATVKTASATASLQPSAGCW